MGLQTDVMRVAVQVVSMIGNRLDAHGDEGVVGLVLQFERHRGVGGAIAEGERWSDGGEMRTVVGDVLLRGHCQNMVETDLSNDIGKR